MQNLLKQSFILFTIKNFSTMNTITIITGLVLLFGAAYLVKNIDWRNECLDLSNLFKVRRK